VHSNAYTFRFAATVTIVCSVLLASAATLLKPRQIENEELDKKKNILASVNIRPAEGESFSRQKIQELYGKYIKGIVVDAQGNIVEGKTPEDIDPKVDKDLYPVYQYIKDGKAQAHILPVSGKGLWSTIYGYLALATDCSTIKGITFYKHGETPGLGGEISKDWFTANFVGKKIRDTEGNLVSIQVVKGKVRADDPKAYHEVDGISGATLTGRGVTNFLKNELKKYEPFLKKMTEAEGGHING